MAPNLTSCRFALSPQKEAALIACFLPGHGITETAALMANNVDWKNAPPGGASLGSI